MFASRPVQTKRRTWCAPRRCCRAVPRSHGAMELVRVKAQSTKVNKYRCIKVKTNTHIYIYSAVVCCVFGMMLTLARLQTYKLYSPWGLKFVSHSGACHFLRESNTEKCNGFLLQSNLEETTLTGDSPWAQWFHVMWVKQ